MKHRKIIIYSQLYLLFLFVFTSCGVYSLSGASIQGKTINVPGFENKAANVVPTLATDLGNKIRDKILSQSGLTAVNNSDVDYFLKGTIINYNVSISGVSSNTSASQNRLTITVEIEFINNLNEKENFKTNFSRYADFPASQNLQSVENRLIETIGEELADDIFNRAFVNW